MNRGLVYLRPTHLVFIRCTGDYAHSAPAAWTKLIAWMDDAGVPRNDTTFYGIARGNPLKIPAENCRFDACIELPATLDGSSALDGVQRQRLPSGSFTRHRYVGPYGRELRAKTLELCEQVPSHGLRLADERPSVIVLRANPLISGGETGKAEICIPVSALPQKTSAAA